MNENEQMDFDTWIKFASFTTSSIPLLVAPPTPQITTHGQKKVDVLFLIILLKTHENHNLKKEKTFTFLLMVTFNSPIRGGWCISRCGDSF